jgi:geranylgeranyl pyrophosphate synthase
MRRGRLAAYKKFGLQNALVTGDFLFVKAFGIGGKFDDDIVDITANVCAALAEGEIRQKRHAHDTSISRSEYLDIIQRKTALPMSAGAKVAGLMANARLEHIEAVGDYGINLGMAFQIIDDILDVVGDASRLGKPPGTDVWEGNVTLVMIHALNDGSAIDVRALERLIRKRRKQDVDVRRAIALLRDSGAVETARRDAEAYGQLAKKSLDILADSEAKRNMVRLVDYVLSRDT